MTPNEEICCLTHLCRKQCHRLDVLVHSVDFQHVHQFVLHVVDHVLDLAVCRLEHSSMENLLRGD